MKENFESSLASVLIHEGGYVNDKRDPGGATNKGITHRTYAAWLRVQGKPQKNVRDITDAEVAAIYREQYWNAIKGDDLPSGVDYAVFDFAVNSGPSRAAQFLQRAVSVSADGVIGQMTLAAAQSAPPRVVVADICEARLAWLKRLKHWPTFGRGWARRVAEVEAKAMRLAGNFPSIIEGKEATDAAPGKADGAETVTASVMDVLGDPRGWAATAAVAAPAVSTAAQGNGPVQWGIAAVLACLGLAVLIWIWRSKSA